MTRPNTAVRIEKGVCYVDGRRKMLVTADYPYYRDERSHWADRLRKIRDCDIDVVTAYIPWRHHQPERGVLPDFDGRTRENRDVLGFLDLCRDLGLGVIAKPGPFIHAEINYGGLPDWVCPLRDPAIEAMVDAADHPVCWSGSLLQSDRSTAQAWPLPAPLDPRFLAEATGWLRSVGEGVLMPNLYPSGSVVMGQIGNEGIYCDAQHAPWAHDYSRSGLRLFRRHLRNRYRDLEVYNLRHGTSYADWGEIQPPRAWNEPQRPCGLLTYIDWAGFQVEYMAEIYRVWCEAVNVRIPWLANPNPPMDEEYGLDAWLARVEPESWPDVHYGFTNWIGDVSAHSSAYGRYTVAVKRATGVNLEENWGFAELYEAAYADASASFYQTLLAVGAGATGYNVYTGVATADWDDDLDVVHQPPYPDYAPITAQGEATPKAKIVRWLSTFFIRHGEEFLACRPQIAIVWGLYLPYASVAAWVPAEQEASRWPVCGDSLSWFQILMRRLHMDFALANLQTSRLENLERYPFLILHGGEFMERVVQEKLAAYARRGGRVGLLGQVPHLDGSFAPLDLLSSLGEGVTLLGEEECEQWLASECRTHVLEGAGDVWVRSHPQRDVHYLIVLLPPDGEGHVTFAAELAGLEHRVRVGAAPGGGALLRVEEGKLTDAVVKGLNAHLRHAVAPTCTLDGEGVGLAQPGDLAWIGGTLEEER